MYTLKAPLGIALVCYLLSLFAMQSGVADHGPSTPENIPGSNKVDAEGLIHLVETIPELLIIDARIAMDRRQGYIEGSISLPDIKTNCKTLAQVIEKKTLPILFYCNGVKCGRSVNAVKEAIKCGYDKVYWFRGGFEEWREKDYPYLKE